jgi:LmbE family N-acetylglucosaminyl deacetylase
MQNVLFLSPHPDDVELGCLGTINEYVKRGYNVFVAIATDGERGNVDPEKYDRIEESIDCLSKVGVKRDNILPFHLPDTKLNDHRTDIFEMVEGFCIQNDIDTIYINSNKDYHQDHLVVFEEALRAARKVKNILTYESNSSTFSSFAPNYFVNVSEFIDEKVDFLKSHKSQDGKHFILDHSVKSLAKFRGNQTKSLDYAEAFEVFRMTN